jgi:sulfatase maturation enzyme AslB (radical SAM superfamily)
MTAHTAPAPRFDRVFLEVTSHCNFDCQFCTNSSMQRRPGMMASATFQRLIDEIATHRLTDTVLFHLMGDPLLHPEITSLLRYAVRRTQRQNLVTNGSLFTAASIQDCYDTQLTHLSISYFTPTPTLFQLRNAEQMTFDQYQQTIHEIVRCKFEQGFDTHLRLFYPNINLASFNWEGRPFEPLNTHTILKICHEWADAVAAMGVQPNRLTHDTLRRWNWNKRFSVFITDEFEIVIKPFHNWHNSHHTVRRARIGKCALVLNHEQVGILWNGDVVLCCGDYNGETTYGNIHTQPLHDVLDSEAYNTIIQKFSRGMIPFDLCKQCLGSTSLSSLMWNSLGTYYARALSAKMRLVTRTN